ncbi:MAG: AI-2E family transporter [Merdibacter sp.]
MNLTLEKRNQIAKWLIKIAAVCILLYLGLQNIAAISHALSRFLDLIMPLILGGSHRGHPPMRFLEAHLWTKSDHPLLQRLRRPTAFLLSVLFIIGAFLGVILLVIPELVDAFSVIAQGIAELVEKLSSADQEKLMAHPLSKALMDIDWDGMLASAQEWLKAEGGQIVDTAFGTLASLSGGIFDFFIAFVFSVYILFGKEKLTRQASRLIRVWIPGKGGEWLIHAASITNVTFRKFISGQSLEALILGSLCMIGMLILQLPYAPMVGALVGVTALIPVVGAFIGTIIGAFMILTVSPIQAVVFVIYLLILQQIEGNLIYPKVMGSRVNMPGMWIMAAVTVGGGIGGPIGMLLSVPIASTAYTLLREATKNRERQQFALQAAGSEKKDT